MVLDRPVDEFGADLVRWAVEGGPVPDGCRVGMAPLRGLGADEEVWAELDDDMAALAEAPAWAAAAVPTVATPRPQPTSAQLKELEKRLSLPLPAVLDLVDGKRPPMADEAVATRDVLGMAPPPVAPPPPGLVVELEHAALALRRPPMGAAPTRRRDGGAQPCGVRGQWSVRRAPDRGSGTVVAGST